MWKNGDWVAVPLGVLFCAVGYWIGLRLSAITNIQPFKVMNIIGLVSDLAGIAILSKFIMSSAKARTFVVDHLTPQLTNMFAGVPTGMVAASILGPAAPSQLVVREFSIVLQFVLAWPGLFYVLYWAKRKRLTAVARDRRVTIVGGFFLVFGVLIQLVAAFQDLYAN